MTALEPILRACDGTWIAHGSGDADRETVDEHDRLRVPPDHPEYTLRRVWLTKEEEQGYYYGFANEGLWPLCHIAHTRPIFRAADWQSYQEVNRKFADAVLEEMEGIEHALVLVQDYHFALLPRMIKEARPDARVAIFWHIPWPNPEAFGICPWQRELLDGLLGADLIGFHIQAHCNNFLETVDAALESRIEWERFAVKRDDHTTLVRPFPISVDFRESQSEPGAAASRPTNCAPRLLKNLGVQGKLSWGGRRPHRLHQGHRRALPRRRAVPRKISGLPQAIHLRADRRAQPHEHPALPRSGARSGSGGQAHQRPLPDRATGSRSCCSRATTATTKFSPTTAPRISAWSRRCTTA